MSDFQTRPTLNLVPLQYNRLYINIHFVRLACPALPCPPPLLFPSLLFVIFFICITDIHGTITLSYCRFAYNVTFHELNQAVVKSLLESSLHDSSMQRQEMFKNLKKVSWLRNDLFRFSSPLSSCERSRFQLAKSFFSQTVDHLLPMILNYIKNSDGQRDVLYATEVGFVLLSFRKKFSCVESDSIFRSKLILSTELRM